jgi:nitrile hydratase subunit beta
MTDEAAPRAMHDIGGVSRYLCEPVDTGPHELTDFDREVDAIRGILGAKKVMSVDELRRGIEQLPEADYLRLSYYERWLRAMTAILLGKGVINADELRAALEKAP